MLILVSGATATVRKYKHDKNLGVLITPQAGNPPPLDLPWAADNAAYSNWDETKFIKMLDKIEQHPHRPIFVACPDHVGCAKTTAKLFRQWQPELVKRSLPVAMVLQDGSESIGLGTSWNNIDAVFIGGTTQFKLGQYVRWFAGKTKSMGKWLHMGRVNSQKRIKYARDIGCDSIDGTSFSMFPDQKIIPSLRLLKKEQYKLF